MKKLYWTRAVKLIALALALVLVVLFLQEYTFREYWEYGQGSLRIKGFYREPEDSLDVVLIGDSMIYAGYSPACAYDVSGLRSYHYAIGSNVCTTWKSITEEILRTQDPQLIVVAVGGVTYDSLQETYESSSTIHVMADNMPLSWNRLRTIRELMDRYGDSVWDYYIPFIRYHSEWSGFGELLERTREMFSWKYVSRNVLKGTVTRVSSEPAGPSRMDVRQDTGTEELAPESEEVLREYLEYCREKDLNVLFVSVPCRVNADDGSRTVFLRENRAGEIIEEYGFPFLNLHFYTDEIGLDMDRDYYNDSHLNYRGQIKFTEYLSSLLLEEYGVTASAMTDEQRSDWERSAAYIRRFYAYAEEMSATGETGILSERMDVMAALDAMADGT